MVGFPGLETAVDGTAYIDPAMAGATLDAICDTGATLLVILTEEDELPPGAYAILREQADFRGLELAFIPIPDFQTPDTPSVQRWFDLQSARTDLPSSGGTVAFSCQYGAGRSGLMSAFVLLLLGQPLDTAVTTVRGAFHEAIESDVQMAWLERVSAWLKDESQTLDLDSGATHS